jgi:hypothetical protein
MRREKEIGRDAIRRVREKGREAMRSEWKRGNEKEGSGREVEMQ